MPALENDTLHELDTSHNLAYLATYLAVLTVGCTALALVGTAIHKVLDNLLFFNCTHFSFATSLVNGWVQMPMVLAVLLWGPLPEGFCIAVEYSRVCLNFFMVMNYGQSGTVLFLYSNVWGNIGGLDDAFITAFFR